MFRLILLIGFASLCAASSHLNYYRPQIGENVYTLNRNNVIHCQRGGEPICARDRYREYKFENECFFNSQNYRLLLAGIPELVRSYDTPSGCRADCYKVCPLIAAPVCASRVGSYEQKTFSNECELSRENCLTYDQWYLVHNGTCTSTQTAYSPVYAHAVKTNQSSYASSSSYSCNSGSGPVCASNSTHNQTFADACEVERLSQSQYNWTTVGYGPCNNTQSETHSSVYGLPKIYHTYAEAHAPSSNYSQTPAPSNYSSNSEYSNTPAPNEYSPNSDYSNTPAPNEYSPNSDYSNTPAPIEYSQQSDYSNTPAPNEYSPNSDYSNTPAPNEYSENSDYSNTPAPNEYSPNSEYSNTPAPIDYAETPLPYYYPPHSVYSKSVASYNYSPHSEYSNTPAPNEYSPNSDYSNTPAPIEYSQQSDYSNTPAPIDYAETPFPYYYPPHSVYSKSAQ